MNKLTDSSCLLTCVWDYIPCM